MCDYSSQAAIRKEALADMIRIAEEAGLYEDEPTLDEAVEAVKRVRELHKEVDANDSVCGDPDCCGEYIEDWTMCQDCYSDYPCPTIKALDGEQE